MAERNLFPQSPYVAGGDNSTEGNSPRSVDSTTNNPGDLSNDLECEDEGSIPSANSSEADGEMNFENGTFDQKSVGIEDQENAPRNSCDKHDIETTRVNDSYLMEWVDEFEIPNFTAQWNILGPTHRWRGVEWNIMFMLSQDHPNHVSIFLGYEDESLAPDGFVADIKFHFELVDAEGVCHSNLGMQGISSETSFRFAKSNPPEQGRQDRGVWQTFTRQILKILSSRPPHKVYIKTKIEEVFKAAVIPVGYDSKKATDMVGLENLGATCYLNALLQMLFHINGFRRTVYALPHSDEAFKTSTTLALQSIFKNLQTDLKEVTTKDLTAAFGWTSAEAFQQQDVQEMMRVLLEKLEDKMKGTKVDGYIKNLFAGSIRSFIRCVNVEYESKRDEDFYDIQLDVKDCKTIYDSFRKYTELEMLDGENQYDAGTLGKQDAKKGVTFTKFPPVLTIHLKRFDFDMLTMDFKKIHDHYQFPTKLELDEFLAEDCPPESRLVPNTYMLHSVLVHAGDVGGGHYYAYIRPSKGFRYGSDEKAEGFQDENKQWYKFNDEQVVQVQRREAVEQCYGRKKTQTGGEPRGMSSAYMLVYIRESEALEIMQDISSEDIPLDLATRLDEEMLQQRVGQRKLQRESMFINVWWASEPDVRMFNRYTKTQDLFSDKSLQKIKVTVGTTKLGVLLQVASLLGEYPFNVRIWVVDRTTNNAGQCGPYRLTDDVCIEELQHKVSHQSKFFVQELEQDDWSGDADDDISDGSEHKVRSSSRSGGEASRQALLTYRQLKEMETAWLEDLRTKLREKSPPHYFFDDTDPVEGCGIGRGNAAVLGDLKTLDEQAAMNLADSMADIEKRMFQLFVDHGREMYNDECLVFVKAYDPYDLLHLVDHSASPVGTSSTSSGAASGGKGREEGFSPSMDASPDQDSDNDFDDSKSHVSMAVANSDADTEVSHAQPLCLKREAAEEYIPMKYIGFFVLKKGMRLGEFKDKFGAHLKSMMSADDNSLWGEARRYQFYYAESPAHVGRVKEDETMGNILHAQQNGLLVVDLQRFEGDGRPPPVKQSNLYDVHNPGEWLKFTYNKRTFIAEPVENISRILRIMRRSRKVFGNDGTFYQHALSSEHQQAMLAPINAHVAKRDHIGGTTTGAGGGDGGGNGGGGGGESMAVADEMSHKIDLSMGQLAEQLGMIQTTFTFTLPHHIQLRHLVNLLAEQLCVNRHRVVIYLATNLHYKPEDRLMESRGRSFPLYYQHELMGSSILNSYETGRFAAKAGGPAKNLYLFYNILPMPLYDRLEGPLPTTPSDCLVDVREDNRVLEFRLVDERLRHWRRQYIEHLKMITERNDRQRQALTEMNEVGDEAEGVRSPVLASPDPKRRRSMEGDMVSVEGSVGDGEAIVTDGGFVSNSGSDESSSSVGIVWHTIESELALGEEPVGMDSDRVFVKIPIKTENKDVCSIIKKALGVPKNIDDLVAASLGPAAYEREYSTTKYKHAAYDPWSGRGSVTSDTLELKGENPDVHALVNSFSIVLLKLNQTGIPDSAIVLNGDPKYFRDWYKRGDPAGTIPFSWAECQPKCLSSLMPVMVQHVSPRDVYYMCCLGQKKSIVVSVFNFTLLGNQVSVCGLDEFSGPFISYIHEDDTLQTLTDRFGAITGDSDDSWSRCKIALVKDTTPYFISSQRPSVWTILNEECPFYQNMGYSVNDVATHRWENIERGQRTSRLTPALPRIGIQRSVQDMTASSRARRANGNGSIKIV